jgi:hypothetical protein
MSRNDEVERGAVGWASDSVPTMIRKQQLRLKSGGHGAARLCPPYRPAPIDRYDSRISSSLRPSALSSFFTALEATTSPSLA